MGFGSEIFFLFALGFVLLGPKRLPTSLGYVARAKAQLKHLTQSFATELEAAPDISHQRVAPHAQTGGEQ